MLLKVYFVIEKHQDVFELRFHVMDFVEKKLRMSRKLYFKAKYDLICLFTTTRVKIYFPLVSPCTNVM